MMMVTMTTTDESLQKTRSCYRKFENSYRVDVLFCYPLIFYSSAEQKRRKKLTEVDYIITTHILYCIEKEQIQEKKSSI